MIFRGNEKLGSSTQLSLKMEEMGGELNAVTSFDLTEFWLDFHIRYLEKGIQRFCEFLHYPLFERVEIERGIIIEEILADYNNDNQLIDLDSITAKGVWPDHPMGMPVIGNRNTIESITVADLKRWYQEYYQPGNMIIGITGDFDIDNTIAKLENQFSKTPLTRRKSYNAVSNNDSCVNQIQLTYDKDNQFGIEWAFPAYPLTADLRIQYQILRRILDDGSSSRLQKFIREDKGLVYDISAESLFFESGVLFSIHCYVGLNKLHELVNVLSNLLKDIIDNGITQDELDLAKLRFQLSLDCNHDNTHGILYETISPLIYPNLCSFKEISDKMEKVTTTSLNQTFKGLFQHKNSCFSLVGPWTEENKKRLEQQLSDWIT